MARGLRICERALPGLPSLQTEGSVGEVDASHRVRVAVGLVRLLGDNLQEGNVPDLRHAGVTLRVILCVPTSI
jgi:hypothetical protein